MINSRLSHYPLAQVRTNISNTAYDPRRFFCGLKMNPLENMLTDEAFINKSISSQFLIELFSSFDFSLGDFTEIIKFARNVERFNVTLTALNILQINGTNHPYNVFDTDYLGFLEANLQQLLKADKEKTRTRRAGYKTLSR